MHPRKMHPRQDLLPKRGMAEISHLWTDWYLIYTLFTPIKVNYPMSDKSTLRDAGCFFFGLAEEKFGLIIKNYGLGSKNFGLVAIKVVKKV